MTMTDPFAAAPSLVRRGRKPVDAEAKKRAAERAEKRRRYDRAVLAEERAIDALAAAQAEREAAQQDILTDEAETRKALILAVQSRVAGVKKGEK
jgi:hypothetical protein